MFFSSAFGGIAEASGTQKRCFDSCGRVLLQLVSFQNEMKSLLASYLLFYEFFYLDFEILLQF